MKKIVSIAFAFCFSVFGTFAFYLASPLVKAHRDTRIQINVDRDILYQHVEALTKSSIARSYDNIASLDSAANYISSYLKQAGYSPEEQKFKVNGSEYKNVIVFYGDRQLPRVVIGAHYDVCDHLPGADDNASGVAALLEIARLLQTLKPKLSYCVELVAYALEEPPYFRTTGMGSYVHAKSLFDNKINVISMVSLEMLGYYSDERHSQSFPLPGLGLLYPDKGNFVAVVGKMGHGKIVRHFKKSMRRACDIGVESINAPGFVTGVDFSDHLNYWHFGFDALMITDTSFFRNKNYHQPTDTIETLNFDKMAEAVKGIYWAAVSMEV
jgi:Zn-dependent M28 family amino/carboxypeptidase